MYTMKICFVFWFSLCIDYFSAFLGMDQEKIATEGMSTTVICSYDAKRYKFTKKYWCRGSSRASCEVLGDTEKQNYNSRLLLSDNRKGVFLVIMKQLVEDDSGTYWCGIDRPYADIMIAVTLKVNKGPEIQGYVRTITSSTQSSIPSFTVKVTTAFPVTSTVTSKVHVNETHLSNPTRHHNVTEGNWNCCPWWRILRWGILVLLVASLMTLGC